ncbi:MAG: TIM barrel protein [Albidovulum sp.]|nr:TIM barrel protein [Albidovulum sp.]
MPANSVSFALNHMSAPNSNFRELIDLAASLGCVGVEFRNDLPGKTLFDGEPARNVRDASINAGVRILALAEVKRFNDGSLNRAAQADELIELAVECGAEAVSLIPVNDASYRPGSRDGTQRLRDFLAESAPKIRSAGLLGYVEPLGFSISSLRTKKEALSAINEADASDVFRLIHDTFHHAIAGEPDLYPSRTGLVHISGVNDSSLDVSDMEDGHRELVTADDRIGNIGQIEELRSTGYAGPFSFEPFAKSVHEDRALADSLTASMRHIRDAIASGNEEPG